MTSNVLLEQLIALHEEHVQAHRRMISALERDDLLALIEASRRQGSLCTEQGALLADYVAGAMAQRPDVDPTDRERINALARQLREEHLEAQKKIAG